MKYYLKLGFKMIPRQSHAHWDAADGTVPFVLTGQLYYKSIKQGYVNTPASSSNVEAVLYGYKHDKIMSATLIPQLKYLYDPGSELDSLHKSCKSANRPQCDGVDVSSILKNGTMKKGKANSRINKDATEGASCSMQTRVVDISLNHQQCVASSTSH